MSWKLTFHDSAWTCLPTWWRSPWPPQYHQKTFGESSTIRHFSVMWPLHMYMKVCPPQIGVLFFFGICTCFAFFPSSPVLWFFGLKFHVWSLISWPPNYPHQNYLPKCRCSNNPGKFSDFYVDHTVSSHENTKHFFSAKVTRLALTVMSVLAQFFQFTVWGSTPWGGKYAMQSWPSFKIFTSNSLKGQHSLMLYCGGKKACFI